MISIVTITLNNFDELKKTLKSIPQNDFIESIIINGGENKQTEEYLKSYKGKVINEKDSGIADAFNKGIKNSSGDSIMFLNSGDILIEPTYLKEADDFLGNNKHIDFIHSNLLFKDLTGADIVMQPTFGNPGRGQPYLHPTMIMRRKIYEDIGLFNINYKIAMDFDFILRILKRNYTGFYRNKGPVILMEGSGKSAIKEWDAIKECYRSLKENDFLNLRTVWGLFIRVVLYFFRKVLVIAGGGNLLKILKEKKYRFKLFN